MRKYLSLCVLILLCLGLIPQSIISESEPSTYSLSFNDLDTHVQVSDSSSLKVAGNLTVTFWVKLDDHEYYYNAINKGQEREFEIYLETDGSIWFYHGNGTHTDSKVIAPADSLPSGSWYHVAVTRNASSKQLKCYINATLADTVSYSVVPLASNNDVFIGWSNYLTGDCVDGLLDEILIFNRVLSGNEIVQSYNSGLGTYAPNNISGLVAWWKMDEGTGTDLYDRSGNNNHGNITWGTSPSGYWATGNNPDWFSMEDFYIQPNYVGTLSSPAYRFNKLTFTVSAPSQNTSSTKVYSATKGQPKKVEGADSWNWEPSGYITLFINHQSSRSVSITWSGGASGSYMLTVHVTENMIPLFGVTVSVDGQNKTTNFLGDATFVVEYGSHSITAYNGEHCETKLVDANRDRTVGFNFNVSTKKDRGIYVFIGLPIGIVIIVVILIFFWRRR